MDVKNLIKEAAYKVGMDMCGIASLDRFEGSIKGRHPKDVLPGCKSVIVIGVRLLDGIVNANFRAFEDGRRDLKGLWGTYGYGMLPNFELTYACYAVAQTIERELGAVAMPLSTGPMTNGAQISIRHAAVAAGLGEFGWMSIVLTPDFGPRNRFGVILTTAEIEPDPMYGGPKLCDPTKCDICVKSCPINAIPAYGEGEHKHVEMGGKTYDYCSINMPRCQAATQGMTKALGGRNDYLLTNDPTPKDIAEASAKMPIEDGGLQHHPSWHCGACQSYCPVGNWNKRFKTTGLSKGIRAGE